MTQQYSAQIHEVLQQYHHNREELVPMLRTLNDAIGFLPKEALQEVAHALHLSESQVYGVATFYSMLATKPHGQYVVKVCESAPCHVVGGREVIRALREELKIAPGETTPDGKFTLEFVSCLGVCGVGPVMMVNSEVYGNLTPAKAVQILQAL